MKVNLIGAKRVQGNAKASGKPFDICTLFVMVAIEQVNNDKVQVIGGGFEIVEMPVLPEAFEKFANLKYPASVEIQMETQARFGKFESVCVGLAAASVQPKAA